MSALDEIKKKPSKQRTKAEWCILIVSDGMISDTKEPALAEEAAAELLKLREENAQLKGLLYESKHINALANSEGGSVWGMVKDDLDERIDEVLDGFTPNAD